MNRIVISAVCILNTAVQLLAADLYVSTDGNDGAPGTFAAPFKTLSHAKTAVSALLSSSSGAINVYVRGGTYYLDSALTFTPADGGSVTAPITYSAYKGETVVLSGGKKINSAWTASTGNIMVTTLAQNLSIDQLFVNGTRQIMARYPNYDANTAILNGYAADCVSPSRAARWSNPSTGFIRALHDGQWGGNSYFITGKDAGNNLSYTWVGDNNRDKKMHDTYRMVENIFEELDAPGEWFYDKITGKLYFYPPSGTDPSSSTIEVALIDELIRVVGTASQRVSYLTFDGFTYTHTRRTLFTRPYDKLLRGDWAVARAATIFIMNAEHITVKNSLFDQIGGNGILINGYNRNHLITSNEFVSIGATAISTIGLQSAVRYPSTWEDHKVDIQDITVGPLTDDYPMDIEISLNGSFDNGVFEKQTAGVNISMSRNIHVHHNTIHKSPRSGINVNDGTWGGHLIENNDLWDCVRETSDHGPINSWGRDRFWSYKGFNTMGSDGVDKRPFALLDAMSTTIIRNNRIHHTSEWGIDLDDGSTNYDIYNNLLLNCGIKLREGFFRKTHNNIYLYGAQHCHVSFAQSNDSIVNNIFVTATPYQFIIVDLSAAGTYFNSNLFWNFGAGVSMPSSSWNGSYDQASQTADPLFILPLTSNYAVQSTSSALKIGFVNFPMNNFGKPGAPQCPTINYGNGSAGPATDGEPLMDVAVSSILTEALRSATGLPDLNGVCLIGVNSTSYAGKTGFRDLDVIREINGTAITTKSSFWTLYNKLAPGSMVTAKIWRNQGPRDLIFLKASGTETINDSSGVVYSSGWSHSAKRAAGDLNDDVCYSTENGSWFTFDFNGTGIDLLSEKYSDEGDVDVYIDNVLQKTVSCTNESRLIQQAVFSVRDLTAGMHTLKGVKKSGSFMLVDGFTIYSKRVDITHLQEIANTKLDHQRVVVTSAGGRMRISFTNALAEKTRLTIVSPRGCVLCSRNVEPSSRMQIIDFKINNSTASGIYFLQLKTDNAVINRKVLLTK
jgi:hypothetical protein